MIKMAICDDEVGFVAYLEQLALEYFNSHHVKADIEVFYCGSDLAKALKNGEYFDIVFLDIEMGRGKMDGLEVGRILRQNIENANTLLMYISGYARYWKEVCQLEPFGFIEKPAVEEVVKSHLERILRRLGEMSSSVFEFQSKGMIHRIPLNKILYFEGEGHKIILKTTDHSHEFYFKLHLVEKQLQGSFFFKINRSEIINLRYVLEFGSDTVKMADGRFIPISRSRRKEIHRFYMRLKEETYSHV